MAKAQKRQAMGRGLSALLPTDENLSKGKVEGRVLDVPLSQIGTNPFQPRTQFNPETLKELASSIAALGVIQPITVRRMGPENYQLVSGERRFRASQSLNLETIPAFIRVANDTESLEMALVENIQRDDLDPIEISLSYNRLINEIKLTQEEMSSRVGKKRSTVANYLRLLNLDPIIQSGIRDGFISMGHGRALLAVENPKEQESVIEDGKIVSKLVDISTPPNGYHDLGLELNWGPYPLRTSKVSVSLILDNVLDASYRNYLNRLRFYSDEIGRNISLQVKLYH